MGRLFKDDRGQLILIACISIVLSLLLIAAYENSTLTTGESSINRENMDSFYYYKSIRARYIDVYKDPYLDLSSHTNITLFERELKEFALLHGYSVDFKRNTTQARIIFRDKDLRIEEEIGR